MTTITEPTKRHKLTQEDCDIARFFTKRRMKLKEIGKIIGVDPSTVGKIQKADFRLEKYLEQRKEMNRKTAEKKAADAERTRMTPLGWKNTVDRVLKDQEWDELEKKLPEVPGQMKMDLEDPTPAAQDDSAKLMKFQAAMMDKLLKKLDELIDVLQKGGGSHE